MPNVLIAIVVIILLFAVFWIVLGHISDGNRVGEPGLSGCGNSNFTCGYIQNGTDEKFFINQDGDLQFSLAQRQGVPIYNVELACIATSNVLQVNRSVLQFSSIQTFTNSGSSTMASAESVDIQNLSCQGQPKVTDFKGYPWIGLGTVDLIEVNYTAHSGQVNASNPWITTPAGYISNFETFG